MMASDKDIAEFQDAQEHDQRLADATDMIETGTMPVNAATMYLCIFQIAYACNSVTLFCIG